MRYLKFTIENYRAVESGEVAVSNSLIPVIGINESGKTTILQAVLAFDKNKDTYNKGAHLEHKNKYIIEDVEGRISADILIESQEDLDFIVKKMNLTAVHPLYKKLQQLMTTNTPIVLTRSFPSKKYSITNPVLEYQKKSEATQLATALYERLPFILYFDDFSDRVPDIIEFDIKKESELGYETPKGLNQEWHSILEEVFKRATDERVSLSSFLKLKTPDDQTGIMSDIQDILHKEVVEDWKNLKKRFGKDFGEESDDLKLELKWDISDNRGKICFTFKVQDRTTGKGRQFAVTQRSKGFQWFFNFIMKLKFNPKYQANQKGAIYLLDEPGSYLHNSAQGELLKKLKDISDTNTILYCTHSQYLLDPDVINISKIKIAKKEKGKIQVISYDASKVSKNEGALTPLYQALHIKSGFFDNKVKYPVITEGITDFYLFNLLKNRKTAFFKGDVDFIPGAGADNLKDLISNAIAFSENYLLFLDSDEKGKKAFENYRNYFGDVESQRFFCYKLPDGRDTVVLEDHLSVEDQERLRVITGVNNVKSALPVLYYASEDQRIDFINNLNTSTLNNLAIIQGKINSMFEKK